MLGLSRLKIMPKRKSAKTPSTPQKEFVAFIKEKGNVDDDDEDEVLKRLLCKNGKCIENGCAKFEGQFGREIEAKILLTLT